MQVEGKIVETTKKKLVEVEEIIKTKQITINVDQDFIDVINAIGKTNNLDFRRMNKGMSENEALSFGKLYHSVIHHLKEMKVKRTDMGEYLVD